MKSQVFSVAVMFTIVVVGGCSLFLVCKKTEEAQARQRQSQQELTELRSTLESVHGRLGELQQELDSVRSGAVVLSGSTGEPADGGPGESIIDNTALARAVARIEELEARLGEVEAEAAKPPEDPMAALMRGIRPSEPMNDDQLIGHQNTLADSTATDEARMNSLRSIRFLPDERNAHAPVIDDIVSWMETTDDPELREDIIRNLHGADQDVLVNPLLYAIRNDRSEGVREEAAETLNDYLHYPEVVQALEYARDNDVARSVRRQAAESLGEDDDK